MKKNDDPHDEYEWLGLDDLDLDDDPVLDFFEYVIIAITVSLVVLFILNCVTP